VKKLTGNTKLKTKSAIKANGDFPPLMNLQMPCEKSDDCYEFLFHIYNHMNKRVNLNIINSGTYVSAFIELTDVWINSKECGFNWNILQLKVYPEFNFNICLFDDEEVEEEEPKECYHCLYCPNMHIRTHMCINSTPQFSITSSISNGIPPPPPPPPPLPSMSVNTNSSVKINRTQSKELKKNIVFIPPSVNDLLSIKLRPVSKGKINKTKSNSNPTINDINKVRNKIKNDKIVTIISSSESKLKKDEEEDRKVNEIYNNLLLDIN